MGARLGIVVLLVALAGAAGAARADTPVLTGTVGTNDDFQLSLVDPSGAPVQHLAAGTYTLVVHDRSTFHDFHLFGPGGVDVATAVDATGDSTFTVTLVDGVYTFQCDPHALSGMRGQFAVGTASLPRPAARLNGSITGSKAALGGTLLLKAGPAVVTVADRSKTDGFLLSGPGLSKRTGIAFTGKASWSVTLRPGKYTYGSVRSPRARHSFIVSSA